MKKETRTVVYDADLNIEAYCFRGIVQPFLNHFHEHYVIGFVEDGERFLSCKNREYHIEEGNIVVFNPGDNHACIQCDGRTFDYRGIHIPQCSMLDLAEDITGRRYPPEFSRNVIDHDDCIGSLCLLHEMIMQNAEAWRKEEQLLLLLSTLLQHYGQPFTVCEPECRQEIEKACKFIEQHYNERIYLEQICQYVGLSKSTLLRAFIKSKGVTPYRYLEIVRIHEAQKLLRQGVPLVKVAMQTGFSDQSHLTNYFNNFLGLAPGLYRHIFFDKNQNGG